MAVGANDVTHLTNTHAMESALGQIITSLQNQNAQIRIILTGSPDMGSVPRFPWPVNHIADQRTKAINKMIERLAKKHHVTLAPIAKETGPTFKAHPELFAADKFHPTTQGYDLWIPVINKAVDASDGVDHDER